MDGERVLKWQARADTREFALFMSLGCESVLSQTLITESSALIYNTALGCGGAAMFTSESNLREKALHVITMFNDKRGTVNHDRGHKFKLKYESVGALTPPAFTFSLSPKHCGRHLEDASLQLCWRSFALRPKGLLSAAL